MKLENENLKHSVKTKKPVDDPTNDAGFKDEVHDLELALEAEMPHLRIFESFDVCFNAGAASREQERDAINFPTAMIFLDLKGHVCAATQRACELLGRPLKDLKGRKLTTFWRQRDRLRLEGDYLCHLGEFSSAGRIHYVNFETSERNFIPVRLRTARLPAQGLTALGEVAVTVESLSAKDVVHRAIDCDLESLEAFSATFPFPVFLKDVENRFVMASEEFCAELSCSKPEEVIGKCDADFFPKKQAAKYVADDNYVLAYGQILESTELHTPPGCDPIQVHVFKLPFFRDGRVKGVICMYWPVEKRDYALGLLNFK